MNEFNQLSTTILIQLYKAAKCTNIDAVVNLTTLATANEIPTFVQNRVLSLAHKSNAIEDIYNTVLSIVIEADVENSLLTE